MSTIINNKIEHDIYLNANHITITNCEGFLMCDRCQRTPNNKNLRFELIPTDAYFILKTSPYPALYCESRLFRIICEGCLMEDDVKRMECMKAEEKE